MNQNNNATLPKKISWWKFFFNRGIGENYSQLNAKRIVLTNTTIGLTLIICFSFIFTQSIHNIYPFNLIFIFFGIIYLIGWWLNKPEKNTRAKALVFFSVLIHATILALTLGPKIDFKTFYIPISIIPFLIFNKNERPLFYFSVLIALINIVVLYTIDIPTSFILSSFSEETYYSLNHAFNFISIGCMVILSFLFMSITELGETVSIEKTVLLEQQNIELENRRHEQEKLNIVKDRFLSIIAHDLKSPIHNLQGISDLILQNTLSRTESEFIINRFKISAKNTSDMLDNLLLWCTSELTNAVKKSEQIYIKYFIDKIFEQISYRATQKKIVLLNFIDEDMVIKNDPYALEIVMRNILLNAIKFSHPGQEIFVRSEVIHNAIKIHVVDHGIGIPPAILEVLFDADISKSRSGTQNEKGFGLGLTLCKQLLEKNKGTISAESVPDQVTTLTITLKTKSS